MIVCNNKKCESYDETKEDRCIMYKAIRVCDDVELVCAICEDEKDFDKLMSEMKDSPECGA